jgi:hypothetical protein
MWGGMPSMAVDPDGRKIKVFYHDSDGKRQKVVIKDWEKRNEVLGKISNVFVQNVKEAFDYLDEYDKASGNNILSKIAGSNRSVKIRESEVQNVDQYNSLTNTVKWDPLSGLEVTSPQDERSINPATDQVYSFSDNSSKPAGQTPAGGLYGELVHGYRDLFEKVESFVDAMISDPLWDNRDERKTNDIEAKVAKLSPKEAVRQKESDYARRVSCPICNR